MDNDYITNIWFDVFFDVKRIMIKFIFPAVLLILIIIFWNKINEFLIEKFKIKMNYISIFVLVLILVVLSLLLYF